MDANVIERRNNDLLDLVKFILSFVVVAIHTHLFDPYLYPWLTLATPLFFIISSYLFFQKLNACEYDRQTLLLLKRFVLRNLKLYAFWFVVLFPVNIFIYDWFDYGLLRGIVNILQNILVGSTFIASWFLSALIIGITIVFFASRTFSNTSILIIGSILYVLVSMRSSYMFLFTDLPLGFLEGIANYESIMNSPVNSFPAGLFWIICGKLFADGYFSKFKIKESIIVLVISAVLLLTEWILIWHFSDKSSRDLYFMTAPCALAIFSILIQLKQINLRYAREMRKISIIIYASHGTLVRGLSYIFGLLDWSVPSFVTFVIVSAACSCLGILILYLEKKKYFKWLKYSH